jgi:hydrogenase maturation protease
MDETREVLVLGIGNLLWADEGFGVRCAERIASEWALPAEVMVMDGGTQGLYLLPYVQAARRLIVFDAVDYGLAPGTLHVVEGDAVPRFMGAKKMSLHQTGFQEVLAAAALTGRLPEELLLIGVQPEELEDYGGSLRDSVKARIGDAVDIAVGRMTRWGFAARRRASADFHALNETALAMGAYEAGRPSAAQASRHGDARFLAG